jgi:Ca2+/Na+ antiporter
LWQQACLILPFSGTGRIAGIHSEHKEEGNVSSERPLPHDSDMLVKEVTATVKIKDIKEIYRLKDRLSVKWWEPAVIFLLFISGFGFIFTVTRIVHTKDPEQFFVFFWFVLLLLTLIAATELLISKIKALRRLSEIQMRLITDLQKEVEHLKRNRDTNQSKDG